MNDAVHYSRRNRLNGEKINTRTFSRHIRTFTDEFVHSVIDAILNDSENISISASHRTDVHRMIVLLLIVNSGDVIDRKSHSEMIESLCSTVLSFAESNPEAVRVFLSSVLKSDVRNLSEMEVMESTRRLLLFQHSYKTAEK